MIEISKFILNEEKKENNTDLMGFNGLFSGKKIIFLYIC